MLTRIHLVSLSGKKIRSQHQSKKKRLHSIMTIETGGEPVTSDRQSMQAGRPAAEGEL